MTHPLHYERIRRRYRRLLAVVDRAVAVGRELASATEALDRAMSAPPLIVAVEESDRPGEGEEAAHA